MKLIGPILNESPFKIGPILDAQCEEWICARDVEVKYEMFYEWFTSYTKILT